MEKPNITIIMIFVMGKLRKTVIMITLVLLIVCRLRLWPWGTQTSAEIKNAELTTRWTM